MRSVETELIGFDAGVTRERAALRIGGEGRKIGVDGEAERERGIEVSVGLEAAQEAAERVAGIVRRSEAVSGRAVAVQKQGAAGQRDCSPTPGVRDPA